MKRDINLLPDKKGGSKKSSGVLIAIVVTMVYVIVFGIAILVPKSIMDAAEVINKQLENEITQLQPQVDEYNKLKAQLDILRTAIDSTGSLDFSKYKASEALDIIQSTCPSGVMIDRLTNSNTQISMDCVASNNYQIAQFALELERSGHFISVSISGSSPADIIINTNDETEEGHLVRTTLVLTYDLSVEDDGGENAEGDGGGE